MKTLMITLVLCLFAITPALARSHHSQHRHYHHHRIYDGGAVVAHPAGCPWHAFCGCGASARIFGHPVRELFLASNWFRFPRAVAAAGMAAVRNHHVFIIESVLGNGTVRAYDANSGGHQTRIHIVSLAGYTVVDPHGSKVALREHKHHVRYARRHHYEHYAHAG